MPLESSRWTRRGGEGGGDSGSGTRRRSSGFTLGDLRAERRWGSKSSASNSSERPGLGLRSEGDGGAGCNRGGSFDVVAWSWRHVSGLLSGSCSSSVNRRFGGAPFPPGFLGDGPPGRSVDGFGPFDLFPFFRRQCPWTASVARASHFTSDLSCCRTISAKYFWAV